MRRASVVVCWFVSAASAAVGAQSLSPPDLRPSFPVVPAPTVQTPAYPAGYEPPPSPTPEPAWPTATPSPIPTATPTPVPAPVSQREVSGGAPWWLVFVLAVVVAFLLGRALKK
jgi:hypothetical protein